MQSSIDIVLNAFDATGPALQTAASNVRTFAASASQASAQISASASTGGIGQLLGGLVALPSLTTVAAVAVAGFAVSVVSDFASIGESVVETLTSIAKGTFDWGNFFKQFVEVIVGGFAVIEFAFKNWKTIGEFVFVGMQLQVVTFANTIEYYFTKVIPAWLNWFWNNWRDVLKTAYDFVGTFLKNLYDNLVDFFAFVVSWLSGDEYEWEWKGLTDGFKTSINKLPEIAAQQIGAIEGNLATRYAALGDQLGKGMTETIEKRLQQVPEIMGKLQQFGVAGAGVGKSILSQLLGPLLGGTQQAKQISLSLPSLSSERFLTGVQASGEERLAQMQAELNQTMKNQYTLQQQIYDFLKGVLPKEQYEALRKALVEAAKLTGRTGIPLPR